MRGRNTKNAQERRGAREGWTTNPFSALAVFAGVAVLGLLLSVLGSGIDPTSLPKGRDKGWWYGLLVADLGPVIFGAAIGAIVWTVVDLRRRTLRRRRLGHAVAVARSDVAGAVLAQQERESFPGAGDTDAVTAEALRRAGDEALSAAHEGDELGRRLRSGREQDAVVLPEVQEFAERARSAARVFGNASDLADLAASAPTWPSAWSRTGEVLLARARETVRLGSAVDDADLAALARLHASVESGRATHPGVVSVLAGTEATLSERAKGLLLNAAEELRRPVPRAEELERWRASPSDSVVSSAAGARAAADPAGRAETGGLVWAGAPWLPDAVENAYPEAIVGEAQAQRERWDAENVQRRRARKDAPLRSPWEAWTARAVPPLRGVGG